jgi:hypothetical protein
MYKSKLHEHGEYQELTTPSYSVIERLTTMNNKQLMKYIYAFSIGDGSLVCRSSKSNAHFQASQLAKNEDYIMWRGSILQELTSVTYRHWQNAAGNKMIATESRVHPKYTTAYNEMYYFGRKTITPHILSFLDWEMLAIFFQDDGNGRCRAGVNKTPEIRIASHNFNYAENLLIVKACKEILDIQFNIQRQKKKDKTYFCISLMASSFNRFKANIERFVLPSFVYKFADATPIKLVG